MSGLNTHIVSFLVCVCVCVCVKVWGVDLQKNEMIVKDVILVAQGEMALEEFLKQVQCTLAPWAGLFSSNCC